MVAGGQSDEIETSITQALQGTSLDFLSSHLNSVHLGGSDLDDNVLITTVSNVIYTSGEGDDVVNANTSNNILIGGNGNDILTVTTGTNLLDGGAGNDTLTASGNGVHTLVGGTGNDILTGSKYSSDTYLFNLGDGQDVINENDYTGSSSLADKIVFSGVDKNELWLSRTGNDLVVDLIGSDDRTTIKNWYSSPNYQIETIEAGDEMLR